ncbi:hypothetical protein ACFQ36_11090 [Arthrobacter sp. GCM10027362]|uniref:hypothetical protein n=1 Tax=Arthrobacter sp. GCM10027362 TaxID=3273379 RepID=UPI0036315268
MPKPTTGEALRDRLDREPGSPPPGTDVECSLMRIMLDSLAGFEAGVCPGKRINELAEALRPLPDLSKGAKIGSLEEREAPPVGTVLRGGGTA